MAVGEGEVQRGAVQDGPAVRAAAAGAGVAAQGQLGGRDVRVGGEQPAQGDVRHEVGEAVQGAYEGGCPFPFSVVEFAGDHPFGVVAGPLAADHPQVHAARPDREAGRGVRCAHRVMP